DADAQTRRYHALDRSHSAQFHDHLRMQPGLREELSDQAARVAAALAEDQRLTRERERADDALARKLMLRAGNRDQFVFQQQLGLDAARFDRQRDEREV